MFKPEDVRRAFANGVFCGHALEAVIAQVKQALGHALPGQLRSLYLACDGFQGPTGANFLFPFF